ncbi:MAG: synthase [Bacteroidota bacterium]|jgi:NAD+ synthase (glutamine-hydrolysing)
MKIAGATLNQTPLNWTDNTLNIINAIHEAQQNQVQLFLLPELCITAYGCEDVFLAPWLAQKAFSVLINDILPQTENIVVSVGLPIWFEEKLYNCACLIENKTILGFVAKQFLANDGVHYEPRWFTPWEANKIVNINIEGVDYQFGDVIFDVLDTKIAFEICEDAWRKDERPGYRHAQKGVELILNPSASHFSFHKTKLRKELVVESSKLFNCTYLYANLLGNEAGKIIYDGEILIAQNGTLIQQNTKFSFAKYNLVIADVDLKSRNATKLEINPDFESKEEEMLHATSLALWDYLRKSRSKCYVLSLSGGADSSACAVLVHYMTSKALATFSLTEINTFLGANHQSEKELRNNILICAYQSSENSGNETLNSAQTLADSLQASFYHWSVADEIKTYSDKLATAINTPLNWQQHDIALQNIQARMRAPMIWMLTNIKAGLLITTSNRSEGDVGYATMDGDMAGSIAPIAGVDKAYLLEWLIWVEKTYNYSGLHLVNNLKPTAELRPKENEQTDEKDLMPYPILKAIEFEAIRNRNSPKDVFEILKLQNLESEDLLKMHVNKFFRLWSINQWKRERTAPSFLLDDFNVDPRSWCRFPILNGGFEALV